MLFNGGFTFGNFIVDVFFIFLFFLWFWLFISISIDLFRRNDVSGWRKVIIRTRKLALAQTATNTRQENILRIVKSLQNAGYARRKCLPHSLRLLHRVAREVPSA
jgi:hypothetical protein